MKQLFYVLAVVAIGAAGYFGWEVKGKHAEQIVARKAIELQNKNLSADIADREGKKAEAEDALTVAKTERAEAEQGLKASVAKFAEFERTLADVGGLLEEAAAEEAQVTKVIDSIKELFPGTEIDEVPAIYDGLVDKQKKLTAEVETLEGVKKRLEEDVAKNKADIVRVTGKIDESKARVASNTFQATVTGVSSDWDFVVIGAGSKAGLKNDSRLLVQRDGRLLGKLEVSKIEANRVIADIVPGSLRAGVLLQAGDQVILEKTRSN